MVDPESVAQLIGFDKNGEEIYFDDTVINDYGEEFPAFGIRLDVSFLGRRFTDLRLKGA